MIHEGPWLRHQLAHWEMENVEEKKVEELCLVCAKPGEHEFHMTVRCGWCQEFIGFKPCGDQETAKVSHGMCSGCVKKWEEKIL